MTEEIIIDGVDVAGCEFLLENNNLKTKDCECINHIYERMNNSATVYSECKDNANCYYKQLKRLEQENKELKKQHYEALKMLKHEYDGRQRDNEQWFTRCSENHNEDSKIIDNYRSALEEIRGLLSPHCTQCSQVLDIINEVLNDSRE